MFSNILWVTLWVKILFQELFKGNTILLFKYTICESPLIFFFFIFGENTILTSNKLLHYCFSTCTEETDTLVITVVVLPTALRHFQRFVCLIKMFVHSSKSNLPVCLTLMSVSVIWKLVSWIGCSFRSSC